MTPKIHDRYGKYAQRGPLNKFGIKFFGCWPRLRGACLIEVHLHEKSFGGNVKWLFKTDACFIQVTTSTGGTVFYQLMIQNSLLFVQFSHSRHYYTVVIQSLYKKL